MSKRKAHARDVFPPGWDEKRVRAVIDYYDSQSEDEELEEITRILDDADFRVMRIPLALVPEVEKLLHRSRNAGNAKAANAGRSRKDKVA